MLFFGVALVNNVETSTYIWVLEKFLKINQGKKPQIIITDQDNALQNAVEKVLGSQTRHLICRWHLEKNIRSHFAYLSQNKVAQRDLKPRILNLIYCATEEDFGEEVKIDKARVK